MCEGLVVHVGTYMDFHACGGQKITSGVIPSIMWIIGMELMSSGLLTHDSKHLHPLRHAASPTYLIPSIDNLI